MSLTGPAPGLVSLRALRGPPREGHLHGIVQLFTTATWHLQVGTKAPMDQWKFESLINGFNEFNRGESNSWLINR